MDIGFQQLMNGFMLIIQIKRSILGEIVLKKLMNMVGGMVMQKVERIKLD